MIDVLLLRHAKPLSCFYTLEMILVRFILFLVVNTKAQHAL